MVWIILIAFIKAGKVSMICWGVPVYNGSMNFYKVERYFTLSFASLRRSVKARSSLWKLSISLLIFSWPYFFPSFCLYLIKFALTMLKSLLLSCSDQLVMVCILYLQNSSSVFGPGSMPSFFCLTSELRKLSIALIHKSNFSSNFWIL